MDSTFFQIFSPKISESITVYVFLIVVVLCFIKYILFKQDIESKGVQKIIGGLSVFVVALLSHSWQVQALSLFIGGLIIASEEFMQKLAIIVRSESKDLSKNLEVVKPTKEEIKEKREAEVTELKQSIEKTSKRKVQRSTLLRTVILAESLVSDYFKEKIGDKYQEDIKLLGVDAVADGAIMSGNFITRLVEIKHLSSLENALETVYSSLIILRKDISLPIIFCIVLDNQPTQSEITKFLSQLQYLDQVEIGIFYVKNDRLIPLVEPKL